MAASYFKKSGTPAQQDFVNDFKMVFWTEAMGVWVFALAWLTKGKADLAFVKVAMNRREQASKKG